jgi:nucleoid DNA-binding protein
MMNRRKTITHVARLLPDRTQGDIAEIYDLICELWQTELVQPDGCIHITDVGKLSIESQQMKAGGTVKNLTSQDTLVRIYGRFKPTRALKQLYKGKDTHG